MHLIARINRGGTATWLDGLTKGLRDQNIETALVAGYCPENEIEDSCFQALGGIRVENLGRKLSLLNDLRAFFEIRKIIKDFKPDILNTHTAKAGALGRIAAKSLIRNQPRIVHTYHGHVLTGYFNNVTSKIFRIIEQILALITDLFLVTGEKVKQDLLEMGIGEKNKYRCVNPGIRILKKHNKDTIKSKYQITKSVLIVGWMGRLTAIKQPEMFLDLAKTFPNIQFLIAGEGELKPKLEFLAGKNIKFLGWMDTAEMWSMVDIGVLTSENEGKPMSVVEAAQIGVPMIAHNVGAISEMVIDNSTGLLFNEESELIPKLNMLINDANLRQEMGAKAREFALLEYGMQQFIDSHIKIYKELL